MELFGLHKRRESQNPMNICSSDEERTVILLEVLTVSHTGPVSDVSNATGWLDYRKFAETTV